MSILSFFIKKNALKVALQYLFSVFILLNIVYNLELNLELKIDPKMRTFKNLDEIWKTLKIFGKNNRQLCKMM